MKTDKELAKKIEDELWANLDKLYERKKPAPKAKITNIPAAEPSGSAVPEINSKAAGSSKIDVLVDD